MTSHSLYDRTFYEAQKAGSLRSARRVFPLLLELLANYPIRSVCDFGCGVGTWLHAATETGIADVRGFDGDYVPRDQLEISAQYFRSIDLSSRQSGLGEFDLALSLEVGEHIDPSASEIFTDNLARLAPVILFSACPPTPAHGTGHINERTQSFWAEQFYRKGFVATTALRDAIWGQLDIEWFYRQNVVLYLRPEIAARCRLTVLLEQHIHLLDVRHPEFAAMVNAESVNVHSSRQLIRLILRRVQQRLSRVLNWNRV
jgi:hypothetical protein